MEPINPPPPADEPPPIPTPAKSPGRVALRAVLGFLTYVLVGWLGLAVGSLGLMPLLLLVVAAIVLGTTGQWPGFALGVFIGVGLTLLGIGACFAVVLGMKH